MSKLEQFIKDNRDAFDGYEPGSNVWNGVEKDLPSGKTKGAVTRKTWLTWSAVAAMVMMVLAAVYYPALVKPDRSLENSASTTDVPREYAEEVYHFTRLIELKHKQLKKMAVVQPDLFERFSADINRLDSNYRALKKELPDNPNQEMLIQAMVQNLQWQIDLLNQQLSIIQNIKQYKNNRHEKYRST